MLIQDKPDGSVLLVVIYLRYVTKCEIGFGYLTNVNITKCKIFLQVTAAQNSAPVELVATSG